MIKFSTRFFFWIENFLFTYIQFKYSIITFSHKVFHLDCKFCFFRYLYFKYSFGLRTFFLHIFNSNIQLSLSHQVFSWIVNFLFHISNIAYFVFICLLTCNIYTFLVSFLLAITVSVRCELKEALASVVYFYEVKCIQFAFRIFIHTC